MQKQYVWASKIDFANPFFSRLVRSPTETQSTSHMFIIGPGLELPENIYRKRQETMVCYDLYMITMEVKSAKRSNLPHNFWRSHCPPVNLLKWFFWNVSEQEWAFTTRNGSFNTKKCLTFVFLRLYFVGLLMPSPDALVSAATFELPIECRGPVEAALWCQRCRCGLLASL